MSLRAPQARPSRPSRPRRGRVVLLLAAAAFAGFIGFTRIALVVHWPSDVFGGWLLGFAVVAVLARLFAAADLDDRAAGSPPAQVRPGSRRSGAT